VEGGNVGTLLSQLVTIYKLCSRVVNAINNSQFLFIIQPSLASCNKRNQAVTEILCQVEGANEQTLLSQLSQLHQAVAKGSTSVIKKLAAEGLDLGMPLRYKCRLFF
jgi:hypothetical protein